MLDHLYARNVSLQTLDGILCHNGESSQKTFYLGTTHSFDDFDAHMEACYTDESAIGHLRPATLEGCVVRISDMIAYVGKDRQDAMGVGALESDKHFTAGPMGVMNAEIINNLTVDIVEHSYLRDHIEMSDDAFAALKTAKAENYERIYLAGDQGDIYEEEIRPMFEELYEQLLRDLKANNESSPLFKHHIEKIEHQRHLYDDEAPYRKEEPHQIVVDYLAAMTDEYFLAAHKFICPHSSRHVDFRNYFDGIDYQQA